MERDGTRGVVLALALAVALVGTPVAGATATTAATPAVASTAPAASAATPAVASTAPAASAANTSADVCAVEDADTADVHAFVDGYDASVDRLPGVLRDRLADERVAVDVHGLDRNYTLVTNDTAQVTRIENGTDDPTLRVTTNASVLCNATASDDPAGSLLDAYDRGAVEISGVGTVRSAAVAVGEAAYGAGRALGIW
ncbi:hypothetical protein MBEHAL_0678 [Halarchaeum acidiphilum MH1-52-1]|uniref:Uncharacterized protein n=1 Tax=Halarchaeum acidiphilum MH1-52-1 TaxID=1261545 RepID=U3AAX9_9EURY|nr:hypothetical protein [Halarchaeum acidiphilum]GAD51918.1 hypothetical protein MBEHAL_0678 [Halarchaeum acidiphilum MH1-52-1]